MILFWIGFCIGCLSMLTLYLIVVDYDRKLLDEMLEYGINPNNVSKVIYGQDW